MLRRAIKGVSIYHPDTAHLHLKYYNFFIPQTTYKKVANALVTPTLSGLWLLPLITIPWVYQNTFYIIIVIILFILLYSFLYAVIPNFQKKESGYRHKK